MSSVFYSERVYYRGTRYILEMEQEGRVADHTLRLGTYVDDGKVLDICYENDEYIDDK